MKARNVIITLFFVLSLFLWIFMKIRFEPQRKRDFNRNLSKVEYSQFALCLMNCQVMTANDITYVLRNGDVINRKAGGNKQPCPSYIITGRTKAGFGITISVIQCGRTTKISKCYRINYTINCKCSDVQVLPVSFIKKHTHAFPA